MLKEFRSWVYGGILILLIACVGGVLALQGWKSRAPAMDMQVYFNNAYALIHQGILPQYGDVSSYGSFSPPATAYLMVPGELVFHDPRLYEKVGSLALHLGTLLGIFLLAWMVFGPATTYLSVILYGLSSIGLSFAGSLWPIGHPFFSVWVAYFACQWVRRHDAAFFAAAGFTWAVGMYQDMAITPMILTLLVVWLLYRPPVFSRYLLIGSALALALWFPYLRFNAGRGYADIRSQLLRQSIAPKDYQAAWCNPNLPMQEWHPSTGAASSQLEELSGAIPQQPSSEPGLLDHLIRRAVAVKDGLLANFIENTPLFALCVILLFIQLAGLVVFGWAGIPTKIAVWMQHMPFLPGSIMGWFERNGSSGASFIPTDSVKRAMMTTLVICLVTPWVILLAVAEPGRSERFFWLWPLQVILLAATVSNLSECLPSRMWLRLRRSNGLWNGIRWMGQTALILFLAPPAILSSVQPWIQSGWSGANAEQVYVTDYIAQQLKAEGKDRAAIGYRLYIYPFMASYHVIDPHYKVGEEFDLLFQYKNGIVNTDSCAEGFSPDDTYRVVQTRLEGSEAAPTNYFDVSMSGFRFVWEYGKYQVFERHR